MQTITLYAARCRGREWNTQYPDRHSIETEEELKAAVVWDNVGAEYAGSHRKNDNFIASDVLMMDCDNDHSEEPSQWKSLADLQAIFEHVQFWVVYSRNHNKVKNGKAARPKFHIYFPIDRTTDAEEYDRMKKTVRRFFPWFDDNAKDVARFFYGIQNPTAFSVNPGGITLSQFLREHKPPDRAAPDAPGQGQIKTHSAGRDTPQGRVFDWDDEIPQSSASAQKKAVPASAAAAAANPPTQAKPPDELPDNQRIPQGVRNSTMRLIALKALTKYGEEKEAHDTFIEESRRCDPPLPERELRTIWRSAAKTFREQILTSPDYKPREVYLAEQQALPPPYYSDLGEAEVLATLYSSQLRHKIDEPATSGWMVYNGIKWLASDSSARGCVHDLAKRQTEQAGQRITQATQALLKAQQAGDKDAERAASEALAAAKAYWKHARKYQNRQSITATLSESACSLQLERDELDADGYLLNTPDGTVDLRTGQLHPHNPNDLCTKVTACTPGPEGAELWRAFLEQLTDGNGELVRYLQMAAGMCVIGEVREEKLVMAYGSGGNGKSTYFNAQALALGDYAGTISSDALIRNANKNIDYELARLCGQRLVIAAELKEGLTLDTESIKKFSSTDPINARAIRESPFSFIPSHSLVLYTNALPTVDAVDNGTWDRIAVVPFLHRFRGQADEVKNYARYLYDNAGPAILQWMIEGALLFIQANYTLTAPQCVIDATAEYRSQSSWLKGFLTECCICEKEQRCRASDLYAAYRRWATDNGYMARAKDAFRAELIALGFAWRNDRDANYHTGLTISGNVKMPA